MTPNIILPVAVAIFSSLIATACRQTESISRTPLVHPASSADSGTRNAPTVLNAAKPNPAPRPPEVRIVVTAPPKPRRHKAKNANRTAFKKAESEDKEAADQAQEREADQRDEDSFDSSTFKRSRHDSMITTPAATSPQRIGEHRERHIVTETRTNSR